LSTQGSQKVFALYQGTTLVVPQKAQRRVGFSPCTSFHWKFRADSAVAAAKALTILARRWHD
jgi:hypothetical protein